MDETKYLILCLIQSDLKHNQLISSLHRIHLETDMYFLGPHKAVAQLMGLGEEVPDTWFAIYARYLENASQYPVSSEEDSLLPVAEECYCMLKAYMDIENNLNSREDG